MPHVTLLAGDPHKVAYSRLLEMERFSVHERGMVPLKRAPNLQESFDEREKENSVREVIVKGHCSVDIERLALSANGA